MAIIKRKEKVIELRKVLFVIIILSLTFTLLSIAPIVTAKKGEEKTVGFTEDLVGSGTLTVDKRGDNLWVYGSIDLTFPVIFGGFQGEHYCKLRIKIKSGEASMGCDFDPYYNTDVGAWVPLYHLEGSGTSLGDETYTINLDASIYEVVPHRKGKKGAIGLEFVGPFWSDVISFTMTIG